MCAEKQSGLIVFSDPVTKTLFSRYLDNDQASDKKSTFLGVDLSRIGLRLLYGLAPGQHGS